ncbi:hypothetical protein [Salipiger mangrovisoli]|uniref:Uncharacterized protein n=1 Tax=Salipiger mangrovisoli TaxID=2865933 RepID=A0ABR9WZ50_9RHOB|nr:hypothetical protein [Salipiger mangrovisoli]MBE9636564.1 hypothetical protein [Salipiger mangrovisoli]
MVQTIATCCYCGSRAALVLNGTQRHELSCASCGAPLRQLKNLKSETGRGATGPAPWQARPLPDPSKAQRKADKAMRKMAQKPRKKRRSPAQRAARGIFDLLEDIFD